MSDGKVVTLPLAKPQWEAAILASDEVNIIIIIIPASLLSLARQKKKKLIRYVTTLRATTLILVKDCIVDVCLRPCAFCTVAV